MATETPGITFGVINKKTKAFEAIRGAKVTVNGKDFQFPEPLPIEPLSMVMEFYYRRGRKHFFRSEERKLIIHPFPEGIKLIHGAKYNINFEVEEEEK